MKDIFLKNMNSISEGDTQSCLLVSICMLTHVCTYLHTHALTHINTHISYIYMHDTHTHTHIHDTLTFTKIKPKHFRSQTGSVKIGCAVTYDQRVWVIDGEIRSI